MGKSNIQKPEKNYRHSRREFLKAAAKRSAVLAGLIAGAHIPYKKPAVRSFFGVQRAYARQTNGTTLHVTCREAAAPLGVGISETPVIEGAEVCLGQPIGCKTVTSAVGVLACKYSNSQGECTFYSAEGLQEGCEHEVSAIKTLNSGEKPGSGIIPVKIQAGSEWYGIEEVDIKSGENFVTIYLSQED
ncbi:hypothetical protein ACFLRM_04640 [Acidobacteriota bacterium]